MKAILAFFLVCLIVPALCTDVKYTTGNGTCADADEDKCLSCFIPGNATATPATQDLTQYFKVVCNATAEGDFSDCQYYLYVEDNCTTVIGIAINIANAGDTTPACDSTGCIFWAESSSNTWIWIVLAIVAVVIVLVIVGVAGFFIYKKRQAAKSQALYE